MKRMLITNALVCFSFLLFVAVGALLIFYARTGSSYDRTFSNAPIRYENPIISTDELRDYESDLGELQEGRYRLVRNDEEILYERALAFAHLKLYDSAIERFVDVLRNSKDEKLLLHTRYNLGVIYLERAVSRSPSIVVQDLLSAKTHFEEALKIDSEYDDARFNLEKIYLLFQALGVGDPNGLPGDGDDPGTTDDPSEY